LIVLLCLILLTSALYSIYGYSHNGEESRSGTDNDNPLTRSTTESCTMEDNIIKCSNIPQDTGTYVASYINENSNNVSIYSYEREYKNYRQLYLTLNGSLNWQKRRVKKHEYFAFAPKWSRLPLHGIIVWYGQHSFSFHRQLAHKNDDNENKNKNLSTLSMGKRFKITH
jgi:hypothetical protein